MHYVIALVCQFLPNLIHLRDALLTYVIVIPSNLLVILNVAMFSK